MSWAKLAQIYRAQRKRLRKYLLMKTPSRSTPARPKARGKTVVKRVARSRWQVFERKLTDLRDALLSSNYTLLEQARQPVGSAGSHVAEAGTDEFDRNQLLRIVSTEQGILREVEDALARIKSGTYGVCELSGKRIPIARLNILPWTRYTAAVEAERERVRGNGQNAATSPVKEVKKPTKAKATAGRKLRKR